jgi:hypothetical protein
MSNIRLNVGDTSVRTLRCLAGTLQGRQQCLQKWLKALTQTAVSRQVSGCRLAPKLEY